MSGGDPEPTFCYLDRADELHGKHTVFGRCIGDPVYSKCFSLRFSTTECVFPPPEDVVKIGETGTPSRLGVLPRLSNGSGL